MLCIFMSKAWTCTWNQSMMGHLNLINYQNTANTYSFRGDNLSFFDNSPRFGTTRFLIINLWPWMTLRTL